MAKEKTVKIEAECGPCDGTGVYHGFAEPKGVGVVCRMCQGTGKQVVTYTPFSTRKRCKGIKTVRLSRGTLIVTGIGPMGSEVSYEDFLKGKMPQKSA